MLKLTSLVLATSLLARRAQFTRISELTQHIGNIAAVSDDILSGVHLGHLKISVFNRILVCSCVARIS